MHSRVFNPITPTEVRMQIYQLRLNCCVLTTGQKENEIIPIFQPVKISVIHICSTIIMHFLEMFALCISREIFKNARNLAQPATSFRF
jgi:hypothetical protein